MITAKTPIISSRVPTPPNPPPPPDPLLRPDPPPRLDLPPNHRRMFSPPLPPSLPYTCLSGALQKVHQDVDEHDDDDKSHQ